MARFRYILWLMAALAVAPAAAQTGSLRVQVLDVQSAPLPGASVTLSNAQHLISPTTVLSDEDGMAHFPILRAGSHYAVEISMPGFAGQRRSDLRITSNSNELIRIQLGESVEETVQVIGTAGVVELDSVGASTKFDEQFLEDMPVPGRFYQNILQLAPGLSDDDEDGNPNVFGARERNFRAEVSGVSNVDPLTGQWLSRINPDSIEELEVIPMGAGVEFGRAQGGFARVLQKQGTNEFEGVFSFLYRTSSLDGEGSANTSRVSPPPEFETIQPSLQLSGPIIKDKLWFRLSHEYIKREDPVDALGTVEVTTRQQSINADQITWQVSPRNKLAFQYQNDPLTITGLDVSSLTPLESSRSFESGGATYSVTWTAPVSSRLLFDTVLAYQDHEQNILPTARGDPTVQQQCVLFQGLPELLNTRCRDMTNTRTTGPYFETSEDERLRFTLRSQATMFLRAGRQSHRLKLGLVLEDEKYLRQLERKADIDMEIEDPIIGEPFALALVRTSLPQNSEAKAVATNWAAYIEDQWKPANNLSLTLGVRVDREEINSKGHVQIDPTAEAQAYLDLIESTGRPFDQILRVQLDEFAQQTFTAHEDIRMLRQWMADAMNINPITAKLDPTMEMSQRWLNGRRPDTILITNTNWAPRFALAWDPWNNGKTKFSLNAGRYYDKLFLAVPLAELEPVQTSQLFTAPLAFPAPPFDFVNGDHVAIVSPLTAKMVDRNLRTPFQDEFSIGFEREVAVETLFRMTYLKRDFKDQIQDVDINQTTGDLGFCDFGPNFGPLEPVPSPGEGQLLFDRFTFDLYRDTDPGDGDGRLDDCRGDFGSRFNPDRPDGRPDLYLRNPAWRELLMIGNFNVAKYEAVVLEVVRRLYRTWQLEGSYTWSQATGDAEEFDVLLGNEMNLIDDESGFLSYDQRHVFKLNFTSRMPWGTRVGTVFRWESGLPFSELSTGLTGFNLPPQYPWQATSAPIPRFRYPSGQRNDQRNQSFWTVDLRLAQEWQLRGSTALQLSVEVFNLLDDETLLLTSRTDHTNIGTRRFGRRWQLGMRLAF